MCTLKMKNKCLSQRTWTGVYLWTLLKWWHRCVPAGGKYLKYFPKRKTYLSFYSSIQHSGLSWDPLGFLEPHVENHYLRACVLKFQFTQIAKDKQTYNKKHELHDPELQHGLHTQWVIHWLPWFPALDQCNISSQVISLWLCKLHLDVALLE